MSCDTVKHACLKMDFTINRYDVEQNVLRVSSVLHKIESFQKIATRSIMCLYLCIISLYLHEIWNTAPP